jgi:hypothetical protein
MTRDADKIFPAGMAQPPPDSEAVRHVMAYFGGLGGRARSERKRASSRANLALARRGLIETTALEPGGKISGASVAPIVHGEEARRAGETAKIL